MKMDELKARLKRERPMVSVTLRMPEDAINDLKRVAPLKGYSGYQALMRAYVGRGLREDLEALETSKLAAVVQRLREQGVAEETLQRALSEAA